MIDLRLGGMRMRRFEDEIKRRRRAWLLRYRREQRSAAHLLRPFFDRFFLLLFILLLFLLPFASRLPFVQEVKTALTDGWKGGFSVQGVRDWIEKEIGLSPSLIPLFTKREEESITAFSMPVKGTVVEDFKQNGKGIILETGLLSQVHPIGTGWVRYTGKMKNLGNVVMIQHGDGKVSLYGFLGTLYVKKDDWVYPDVVIGKVAEQSLYLSVIDRDQAIDPMDVIPSD